MQATPLHRLTTAAVDEVAAEGIAVAVRVGSDTATVERGRIADDAVGLNTEMYAASVTKQLVGYLAALAVTQGRLDPEASVVAILPTLPPQLAPVRVRHLVHHTSGLPDVVEGSPGPPPSNDEAMVRLHARGPAETDAGVRFSYLNTGYVLLAEVVRAAYGRSIGELARTQIFGPLGMSHSRLGGLVRSVPGWPDPPGTVGDGGLWTTAGDLVTWLTAMNRRLLDSNAIVVAESPGALDDGTPLDYAWGVRLVGRATFSHGGSWAGWLAKTVRDPVDDIAVAVLSWGSDEQAVSGLGLDLAERGRVFGCHNR